MKSLSPSDCERGSFVDQSERSLTIGARQFLIETARFSNGAGIRCRAFGANVLLRRKRKADPITGSNGDRLDEFRSDDEVVMTQIRHVPAPTERANTATGIEVCFEVISEGY